MSYPNGVTTTYTYDAAGQVTSIIHMSSMSAVAFDTYTYDMDGNRTEVVDAYGAHTFSYDALNRLTGAIHPASSTLPISTETFTYDAVGNRTSDAVRSNYTYDAANRIVADSSFTYTSDANGNETSATNRATVQTTTFTYNSIRQTRSSQQFVGTVATYKYDAAGDRVEKNVGGTIMRYVYDGNGILAILDGSNSLLMLFTNGPGIASPLIMRSGGQDYFFHADALGSIAALTDTSGNTVETVEYEAFGKAVIKDANGVLHSSSTVGNPFFHAACELDPETNLCRMGPRYHDSETGRFHEEDPFRSVNLYVYADSVGELPRSISTRTPKILRSTEMIRWDLHRSWPLTGS